MKSKICSVFQNQALRNVVRCRPGSKPIMASTYEVPLSSSSSSSQRQQQQQQQPKEEKKIDGDHVNSIIRARDNTNSGGRIMSRRNSNSSSTNSIFANQLRFRAAQLQRRLASRKQARHIPLEARGREKSYAEKLKGLKGKRLKRQQEQAQMSSKFRDFNQKRVLDRISTPFIAPKQMFVPVDPKEFESSMIS